MRKKVGLSMLEEVPRRVKHNLKFITGPIYRALKDSSFKETKKINKIMRQHEKKKNNEVQEKTLRKTQSASNIRLVRKKSAVALKAKLKSKTIELREKIAEKREKLVEQYHEWKRPEVGDDEYDEDGEDNVALDAFDQPKLYKKIAKKKKKKVNLDLPDEMFWRVFVFLDVRVICLSRPVCKQWNGIISSDIFWEKIATRFNTPNELRKAQEACEKDGKGRYFDICQYMYLQFKKLGISHVKLIPDPEEIEKQRKKKKKRKKVKPTIPKIRLVLTGEYACGKTTLMKRFYDHEFVESEGFLYGDGSRDIYKLLPGVKTSVCIETWDTIGEEKQKKQAPGYFINACGVIFCFDETSRDSFENLSFWVDIVKSKNHNGAAILVGCKNDLGKSAVPHEEIQAYCSLNGMSYVSTSAKIDDCVDKAFEDISLLCMEHFKREQKKQKKKEFLNAFKI